MTIFNNCSICHIYFMDNDRVIFSHRETFVFKPAHVQDEPVIRQKPDGTIQEVSAAATLTPQALAYMRKDHQKTAIVNTFCDWGKAQLPEGAFHFRHQWCEPSQTGAGPGGTPANKHMIRFSRTPLRGRVAGGQR